MSAIVSQYSLQKQFQKENIQLKERTQPWLSGSDHLNSSKAEGAVSLRAYYIIGFFLFLFLLFVLPLN